jgi:uncharacterized membrane protein YjgN (DUF898 family)
VNEPPPHEIPKPNTPAVPNEGIAAETPIVTAEQGREADPELNLMTLAPSARGNETVYRFSFTGGAKEYFRIWVVNTLLVILTLGLWSPWAKIRKKKWFLGHTWVAGSNFDFHASPWPIFRGRLLAGIAFFIYWMAGEFQPQYASWVALALAVVAPMLIVGSLRFNLMNTSYRNIRFASQSTLTLAFIALLPFIVAAALAVKFPLLEKEFEGWRSFTGAAVLSSLVFTFFYPYVHGKLRLLALNHSSYGSAPIRCSTRIKTFYSSHVRGSVIGVGVIIVAFLISGAMSAALFTHAVMSHLDKNFALLFSALIALPISFAFLVWYAATQTRLINATFNLTRVSDNVRVFSEIRTLPMAKLYFVNTVAILFTLGLALPWAAVRTAKQRVETTALAVTGDLDAIVADNITAYNATADAATDFFSLDISL